MSFFQNAPALSNLYKQDNFLVREFERRVPKDVFEENQIELQRLGVKSATEYPPWQIQADRNPPRLTQFDAWGHRIDHIETAPYWDSFKKEAVEWRIVGRGHDLNAGPYARVIQCAYMLLFSPTTANYLCPLAMSDAAACVLRKLATAGLKGRLYDRLISSDLSQSITSGQWMTERAGGSDVSKSETIARFKERIGDELRHKLYGVKWFTSAITSEMSLLLAKATDPKGDGLTLFAWERPDMPGCGPENAVKVLRLKDKLGTRALPTAEIELDGTVATQIGEVGRGVSNISEMLNITRFYNAVASASSMNYSSLLVQDYCQKRVAFGKKIGEHVLMDEVVKDLREKAAAATALCFETAHLIGKCEVNDASQDESLRLRAIVSLAKLSLGKAAVAHASETLECFGGAGYIEDTGLPRILRDAQVLPIWEGTTNVLSLDLWRAEQKEGAVSVLISNMVMRSEALVKCQMVGAQEIHSKVHTLLKQAEMMRSQVGDESSRGLRKFALELGESLQSLLLLEHKSQKGIKVI